MKGILLKDIFTVLNNRRQFTLILAMGLVFTFVFQDGGQYISMMFSLMLMMFVYSSFSYDESAKWDRYAATLPVKRSTVVASKYLLTLLCAFASLALSLIIAVISWAVGFTNSFIDGFSSSFAVIAAMTFGLSLMLPITFRFGVEKARFINIVVFMVPYALVLFLLPLIQKGGLQIPPILLQILPWVLPLLLIIMLVVSFFLSVRFYANKEF